MEPAEGRRNVDQHGNVLHSPLIDLSRHNSLTKGNQASRPEAQVWEK